MTLTSIHVLSYDEDRTWDDLHALRPADAAYWHPGVTAPLDDSGLPAPDLRSWTVLACWDDRAAWEAALLGSGPWQGAAEAWSALMLAGPTRDLPAAAQWADGGSTPPFGSPARPDPDGPTAVVTTVGLDLEQLGDALRFLRDVQHVVGSLADAPGNLGYRLGSPEHIPPQVDPFTFSLWTDARAARAWAYGSGVHSRAMDDHIDQSHVLRGTFTTFSVLETCGSWSLRHRAAAGAAAG